MYKMLIYPLLLRSHSISIKTLLALLSSTGDLPSLIPGQPSTALAPHSFVDYERPPSPSASSRNGINGQVGPGLYPAAQQEGLFMHGDVPRPK